MGNINKKFVIIGLIIFVIIVSIFIFVKFSTDKEQWLNVNTDKVTIVTEFDDEGNEQIIAKSIEVFSTKDLKQAQSNIKLPKDYSSCKEDTNMIWCIVFHDKEIEETKKFINKEFVVERLDEIDDFKKELLKSKSIEKEEILKWIIADELQVYYTLTNPSMIFDQFACKNDFCKQIIIETKKSVVWRMISRQKIDTSNCNKIPENEVKKYCLEILSN